MNHRQQERIRRWAPIVLHRVSGSSKGKRDSARTNTRNGFGLVIYLLAPEIQLTDDQNGKYGAAEQGDLDGAQEAPYHGVDPLHLPCRGNTGTVDVPTAKARLPVDLDYLVPHGNHGQDGRDAACSGHEGGGPESQSMRLGDDVDVIFGPLSYRRCGRALVIDRANKVAHIVLTVGEDSRGTVDIQNAACGIGAIELNRQSQQPYQFYPGQPGLYASSILASLTGKDETGPQKDGISTGSVEVRAREPDGHGGGEDADGA